MQSEKINQKISSTASLICSVILLLNFVDWTLLGIEVGDFFSAITSHDLVQPSLGFL